MKIARHAKILELIENYDIETQDELAQRLCEEGFVVTQAIVFLPVRTPSSLFSFSATPPGAPRLMLSLAMRRKPLKSGPALGCTSCVSP